MGAGGGPPATGAGGRPGDRGLRPGRGIGGPGPRHRPRRRAGQAHRPPGQAPPGPRLRPTPDVDRLAGDKARLIAAKEGDDIGDVLRLPHPTERDLRRRTNLEGIEVDPHTLCSLPNLFTLRPTLASTCARSVTSQAIARPGIGPATS